MRLLPKTMSRNIFKRNMSRSTLTLKHTSALLQSVLQRVKTSKALINGFIRRQLTAFCKYSVLQQFLNLPATVQ